MMKKIMFNNKYGLTDAVLKGTKTMTRRMMNRNCSILLNGQEGVSKQYIMKQAQFQVGEIVAIAQSYEEINLDFAPYQDMTFQSKHVAQWGNPKRMKGWNNKMFVRADLMPHHIRITNIKVERLQEISDADCLREGIKCFPSNVMPDLYTFDGISVNWKEPKEAFAVLIDKVGKKGDWNKNPWVYVYEFELVD